MTALPKVIFVSNDIVPGSGLPVAAPGLRVYGLASGLAARGFPVSVVVAKGPLVRQWRGSVPPPLPQDTITLPVGQLAQYLRTQAPAVVVLTNTNQVDRLPEQDGNRYIIDFFAPKMLERIYQGAATGPYPVQDLREVRERKLRGIERASGFIVNGRKKLPYFLAWILQTDRDIRTLPFEHVGMCLPASFDPAGAVPEAPIRFAIAGYLQGWSVPGEWLRALPPLLTSGRCTLDVMLPQHWGGNSQFANPELNRLVEAHAIRVHPAMTFDGYRTFLGASDVVLDLFARTRERELAVITRTISALCCGKPVVHPPFTEVAPLIERFDAGWLIDPVDGGAVAELVNAILDDPAEIARKTAGARELWRQELDPAVAVDGLVKVIEQVAPAAMAVM